MDIKSREGHDPAMEAVREAALRENDAAEISIVEILTTLGRQKRTIGICVVIFLCFGAVLAFVLPSQYTAKTVLMPPQQDHSSSAISDLGALAALGGAAAMKSRDEMYVALLTSDSVADSIINKFNLRDRYQKKYLYQTREILRKRVVINRDKPTGFISVEVTDRSAAFAADIANGYASSLTQVMNRLAITDAEQRQAFFEQQIQKTLTSLSKAEVDFDRARARSGVVSIDGQVSSAISESADLNARITMAEIQLKSMGTFATDENPDVQRKRAEINGMREKMESLERGQAKSDGSNGNSDTTAIANVRAFRNLKFQEIVLSRLREQLEQAQIDVAREGPLIQQIDIAVPPEHRSGPKKGMIIVAALISGLFFGLLAAAARGALAQSTSLRRNISEIGRAWSFRRSKS